MILVLWRADNLVAALKPAGIETVDPDGRTSLTTLLREQLGLPNLLPAHRLDRDTTGVQLFAETDASLERLAALFRQRRVEKTYLGLCLGAPVRTEGEIHNRLSNWQGGRRPVRSDPNGLPATTMWRVVARNPDAPGLANWGGASIVAFFPREGRTHQIRVHAEAAGFPLLGDHQYGDRSANRVLKASTRLSRQALHAWRIDFCWNGAPVRMEAPLPDDWRRAADTVVSGWESSLC